MTKYKIGFPGLRVEIETDQEQFALWISGLVHDLVLWLLRGISRTANWGVTQGGYWRQDLLAALTAGTKPYRQDLAQVWTLVLERITEVRLATIQKLIQELPVRTFVWWQSRVIEPSYGWLQDLQALTTKT
jgi:hypothetical protein